MYDQLLDYQASGGWNLYVKLRTHLYHVEHSHLYHVEHSHRYRGLYRCSWPKGIKDKLCKHAVMLMAKGGVVEYPEEATDIPLEQKRKRGQKRRASTALQLD